MTIAIKEAASLRRAGATYGSNDGQGQDRPLRSCQAIQGALERERARTDRTRCAFALVLFGNTGSRHDTVPLARLADALCRRARETDEVGYFYGPFLCAILTGSDSTGALRFAQDVAAAVGAEADDVLCGVYCYPSAWLPQDIDECVRQRLTATPRVSTNGHASGNGHKNGHGTRAHANGGSANHGNGNGNGHVNGNGRAPLDRSSVENLLPTVMSEVSVGLEQPSIPINGPIQSLFVQPLPGWKRAIDVVGAIVGLVLSAPLMAIAGVLVKLTSRGPIIFRQVRAGHAGRPFTLYKIRTMCDGAEQKQKDLRARSEQDGPAFKMKADPRVTRIGRILRKTSIDELPQLWNVLKGDMSLVGPRPLPWHEACACEPWQRRRLDVTPGLTCIWQVFGRSRVSFAEWMRMDMRYLRARRLGRDLWLLIITIPAVLFRRGAS